MASAIRGSRFADREAALLEPIEQIDKIGTLYAKSFTDLGMLESRIAVADQQSGILSRSNVELRQPVNKVLKCRELGTSQQVTNGARERAQINRALGCRGTDGLAMLLGLAPAPPMTRLGAHQSLDNPGHSHLTSI